MTGQIQTFQKKIYINFKLGDIGDTFGEGGGGIGNKEENTRAKRTNKTTLPRLLLKKGGDWNSRFKQAEVGKGIEKERKWEWDNNVWHNNTHFVHIEWVKKRKKHKHVVWEIYIDERVFGQWRNRQRKGQLGKWSYMELWKFRNKKKIKRRKKLNGFWFDFPIGHQWLNV